MSLKPKETVSSELTQALSDIAAIPDKLFEYDHPDLGPDAIDAYHASIADFAPDPRNANTGTPRGGGMLEDSLQKYGAGRSVVLDKNGFVIAGNKTWEKAGQVGFDDVIVVRTDGKKLVAVQRMDLDLAADQSARELAIADNAIGQASLEWDPSVLLEIAQEGTDMSQFFTNGEWDALMARFESSADEEDSLPADSDPDDIPEAGEPRVKRGDLWILGGHRLYCGDAGSEVDMAILMMSIGDIMQAQTGQTVGDGVSHKAPLVFTDPPYEHAGKNRLETANIRSTMNNLKESEWDKDVDLLPALDQMIPHLAADATVYLFASQHTAPVIWPWMDTWSAHTSWCTWHKNNPMPSMSKRQWTYDSELICYATRGKHTFHFPEEGHALSTWEIGRTNEGTGHPTEKPVALALHAIKHSSNIGDIVLDPFAGSGTTLIACHLSRRVCFSMDKDPRWCDCVLMRFEKLTGIAPERVLEGTGEPSESIGSESIGSETVIDVAEVREGERGEQSTG